MNENTNRLIQGILPYVVIIFVLFAEGASAELRSLIVGACAGVITPDAISKIGSAPKKEPDLNETAKTDLEWKP